MEKVFIGLLGIMLSRFYGDCLCDCHCHRSKCKESRLLILNNFLLKFLALTVSWIDIRNDKEKGLFSDKVYWTANIDQRLKRYLKSLKSVHSCLTFSYFQLPGKNYSNEDFFSEKLISVVSKLSCLWAISIFPNKTP